MAAIGLAAVVGFGPLSHMVIEAPPPPPVLSTAVTDGPVAPPASTGMPDLPLGLPPQADIRTAGDVLPYARKALGTASVDSFMAVLRSPSELAIVLDDDAVERYPYAHPVLDPILDASRLRADPEAATALGAALTLLSAHPTGVHDTAPAAFAVLLRAARGGGCAPQLNLLLLLAGDVNTSPEALLAEQHKARSACPGDPTPDWLVGQRQLRSEPVKPSAVASSGRSPEIPPGIVTMKDLVSAFPGNVAALTGLGDAYLSAGMRLRETQPFSARAYFRQAVEAYGEAGEHGGREIAAPGSARALIGLGEPARAAEILEPLVRSSEKPGPLLEILVAAHETARNFGAAEAAARRLAELGAASYPDSTALFPAPQASYSSLTMDDRSTALSLGADRLAPLTEYVVQTGIGGGVDVVDRSFIPVFRHVDGFTGTTAACPDMTWRRAAVLAGHAEQALAKWPQTFEGVRPGSRAGCVFTEADTLRAIAERELAGSTTRTDLLTDEVSDAHQNLLRWAGDLEAARRVVEGWLARRGDDHALGVLRLAEIDFLTERYAESAAGFDLVARRERLSDWGNDLAVAQAKLGRGAALIAAGRHSEAEAILRPLDEQGLGGFAYQIDQNVSVALDFAVISYYAASQLGDLERTSKNLDAAVEHYESALSWLPTFEEHDIDVDHPGALFNNAALAHVALEDENRASELASQALAEDPMSPVFLMTSGFVADRQGRQEMAVQRNQAALRSDPGAFPAANDLGVQLVRLGDPAAARRAFQRAVGARPTYALGWFNLGILESSSGPARILHAQRALGRAYALDPALKERRRELRIDASVYRTSLDLSKPLPPAWTIAAIPRQGAAASAGLLAALALGFGLARVAGPQGRQMAQEWLEPLHQRLQDRRGLNRLRHPAWAVVATAAIFVGGILRRPPPATEVVTYVIGLLALVGAAMALRSHTAQQRGLPAAQGTWLPSTGFGVAAGAAGFPWAALPVLRAQGRSATVHLAAPVLLAAVSAILFVEAAALRTPLTEAWGLAALTMSASLLLPIGPLDGAHSGKAGIAASAAVVVTALLMALGIA